MIEDLQRANIDQYFLLGGQLNDMRWRTYSPEELCERVDALVTKRLGA